MIANLYRELDKTYIVAAAGTAGCTLSASLSSTWLAATMPKVAVTTIAEPKPAQFKPVTPPARSSPSTAHASPVSGNFSGSIENTASTWNLVFSPRG